MANATRARPHVVINAHLLSGRAWYRSAGIHQYIHYLLRHLAQVGDAVRYTVLLGEGQLAPDVSLETIRSRWPTRRAPVRILWEQVIQPSVLRQVQANLVHGPHLALPLYAPCPAVVTIHDLSFMRFPDLFPAPNRLYLMAMARIAARRARRIIAVSAYTADEIARLLNVERERIDVIYHGVNPIFRPLPPEEVAEFRRRRGLPERLILCVGTLEPRKNHTKLIEAFARIYHNDVKLALIGAKGWLFDEIFAKIESLGLNDAVIFPGYVDNKELPLWYNAATLFAYPSLYEGFGMPAAEAQSCGTPVLTSNTTSLPEATGEAALMVEPNSVEAIAAGMERLLKDELLWQTLRERGIEHASQFTWARTARQTTHTYQTALRERGQT